MEGIRVIPTKIHGILDYLGGILLLLAPNLFGFDQAGNDAAVLIPRALGIAFLGLAVLTNYELGLFKVVPMTTHITIDVIASIFLAASPFIFGFADEPANVWLPHVVVGVGYLIASLMTQTRPDYVDDTYRNTAA